MLFFFFNDTATTEIYTLSLHDALPISAARAQPAAGRGRLRPRLPRAPARRPGAAGGAARGGAGARGARALPRGRAGPALDADRKSTRLNSSHANISYAVFCLKKKKINK